MLYFIRFGIVGLAQFSALCPLPATPVPVFGENCVLWLGLAVNGSVEHSFGQLPGSSLLQQVSPSQVEGGRSSAHTLTGKVVEDFERIHGQTCLQITIK